MDYKTNVKKQVDLCISNLSYHYNTLKVLNPISRYKDIDQVSGIILNLHRVVINLSTYSKHQIYNQLVFLLGEIGLYADKESNKGVTTSIKLFRAKQALISTIKEDLL